MPKIFRGVARPNRVDRGIYGGKKLGFGNKLSSGGQGDKTPKKVTRTYKPNVVKKKLYSPLLDRTMQFRVTPHTLRCIDKAGGFDEYIMNTKDKDLDSALAIGLKSEMWAVKKGVNAAPLSE